MEQGLVPSAPVVDSRWGRWVVAAKALGENPPVLLRPFTAAGSRLYHALKARWRSKAGLAAAVVIRDLPAAMQPSATAIGRLYLKNTGRQPWYAGRGAAEPQTVLRVYVDGRRQQEVRLRHEVGPSLRGHFAFELTAPSECGPHWLRFDLVAVNAPLPGRPVLPLLRTKLMVEGRP
jgi:hypothetical protein